MNTETRTLNNPQKDSLHLKRSFTIIASFTVVLWFIKSVELMIGAELYKYGIYPGQLSGLMGIFLAPLIHSSFSHLFANTAPLLILGTALLYGYPKSARIVIPVVYIGTGLGVWLFARQFYHIGASGLTFGFMFFVFTVGAIRWDRKAIALSMVVFFLYGSMIWGIFPNEPGISFESHFFGAMIGIILAILLRNYDRHSPEKKYSWEEDEDDVTEYKLAHIDKNKIAIAARKGLIAADPLYHAWPPQKREQFRATKNEAAQKKVQRQLLNDLLNIIATNDDVDKIWDEIPIPKLNILNWASLLTAGIGDDYIYLNEVMWKDKSLLDFETLYDYDYADYLFQEQTNKKEFSDYKGYDYYAYKHPSWVRLLIKDQFYYATFLSLATYLHDEIDFTGQDYIDQLIPHEYVNGKDHGNQTKGGFLWDMKLDASGLEGQLDELNHRWFNYLQERWLELSKELCNVSPAVYTKDKDWDDDPHRFFIFSNAETLKKIRWQHFISDCEPLMANLSTIETQLELEITRAKSYLSDNHQDIMNNYDPKVTRLRKKRKIIMSAEALNDLEKIAEDEEPEK